MKRLKRFFAIVLSATMIMGTLSQTAFAADETVPVIEAVQEQVAEESPTQPDLAATAPEAAVTEETNEAVPEAPPVETAAPEPEITPEQTPEAIPETEVPTLVQEEAPEVTEAPETPAAEAVMEDKEIAPAEEKTSEETPAPSEVKSEKEEPSEEVPKEESKEVEAETEKVEAEEVEAEEVKTEETEVEETEEKEPLFANIAEDSVFSEAELQNMDFSSKRLLVAGNILPEDKANELSVYEGVHLMQYADTKTARNAYSYYYGKAAFVFIDSVITVASGDGGAVSSGTMTENSNPLDELATEVSRGTGSYQIALIDTGSNGYVEKAVSMIGDDASDANGHGTKMASLIKEQNPGTTILSIKALGANGTGDASAVYAAIKYAIEANVSIINLSISTAKKTENAIVAEAIAEALSAGITVVAAAGNNASDASYFTPGGVSGVITIGACDENGVKIASSNGGSAVDYYVIGSTTSEAAARYSGYLSAGKSGIDNVLVFDGNGKPEEEPEDTEYGLYVLHYTVTNGQYAAADTKTISFITTGISYDGCGMGDGSGYSDQAFTIQSGGAPGFTQGYCVEPSKHQPSTGTYTTDVTAVTNEAVLKVLYYGFGGPGDITEPYGNRFTPINSAFTREQARHGLTHVVAARVTNEQGYTNDGNIYRGLSSTAIAAVNDLYADIMSRPAPTGMVAYMATPSAGEQTMIFVGEYNPAVTLKINKASADATKSTNGTVYTVYDSGENAEAMLQRLDAGNFSNAGTGYVMTLTVSDGSLPKITFEGSTENTASYQLAHNKTYWIFETQPAAGLKFSDDPSVTRPTMYWYDGNGSFLRSGTLLTGGPDYVSTDTNYPSGGYLKAKKTSANTTITNGNSCYTLSGIQFKVYKDQACTQEVTKDINGNTFTLTTNASGETGTVRLDEGTYYVREVQSSLTGKGWAYNSTPVTVSVSATANATEATAAVGTVANQPLNDPAGVVIQKINSDGGTSSNANLAGAQYTIKFYAGQYTKSNLPSTADATWVIETKKVGSSYRASLHTDFLVSGTAKYGQNADGDLFVPLGTLTIEETKAPTGFKLEGSTMELAGGNGSDATGGVILMNIIDQNAVVVVRSGNQTDDTDEGVQIRAKEQAVKGGASFTKRDSNLSTASGDSSLAGAVITIYANETIIDGATTYSKDQAVTTVTTNASGAAATAARALPSGKYYAKETTAPTGYQLNTTWKPEFTIGGTESDDGRIVAVSTTLADTPVMYNITVTKTDATTGNAQGDANLAGVRFAVVNNSTNPVYYGSRSIAKGQVAAIITTNASGTATASNLPYGTYVAYELRADATITAGETYAGSNKLGRSVYANNAGYLFTDQNKSATLHTSNQSVSFTDTVVKGGVKFVKIDKETGADAQSLATLEGAKIDIYNNSAAAVTINGTSIAKGAKITTLTTDANGECATAADLLPYGTYYAVESKESAGYRLNSTWRVDFQVRENGKIIDTSDSAQKVTASESKSGWLTVAGGLDGKAASLPEQIKRMDLSFIKITVDGQPMANIPFKVSLLDEEGNIVESHIVATDANGRMNTKNRPKSGDKVNSLDSYVSGGVFTDESKLAGDTGVWFGEANAESQNAKLGSLIFGNYLIEEIRCEANKSMAMLSAYVYAEDITSEGLLEAFEDGDVHEQGNIFVNIIIEPESNLVDAASGSKSATRAASATVTDTITYNNLKTYATYKIKTEIFYIAEDGTSSSLGSNTITFKPEKTGTSDNVNGTKTNSVTINTANLKGGYLAAVDTFYSVMSDGDVELLVHNEDFSVESQKVYVPWIGTTAADSETGDHVGTVSEDAQVIDTVAYKGLANDKMYLFEGTLRFADTGEAVTGLDGNPCVVTKVLRVSYSATGMSEKSYGTLGPKDGEVVMPAFEFDATQLEGRTLVVTEALYEYDKYDESSDDNEDAKVIEHYDLSDEDQSVHILKVVTQASDSETGTHTGTVSETAKVIDHVTVTNAIIGQEYIIKGDLVYQTDFTAEDGTEHKAGDVIASHEPVTIVATDTTIELDLEFEVDSTVLEGTSGVVFEDVWHNDVEVATHHDLDSKEQTVNWPKVRTTAVDVDTKSHTGVVGSEASIDDTVTLTNLTVGETYKIIGTLMTSDGEEFKVDGEVLTVESEEFTADMADMTKKMHVTFDSSELPGKSLVVFEKLICITETVNEETGDTETKETEVARHEDPSDEGQTINYPEGHTNANDGKTGDGSGTVGEKETIIDTVSYKNLTIGEEYTIKGDLHYLEDCTDADGNEHKAGDAVEGVTSEVTFTAEKTDGTIDLTYELDSTLLRGLSVVVFENFYNNDILVYSHADLEDEAQRVDYPDVKTNAKDAKTEDHVGDGTTGKADIIDTVTLTNLTIGKEYTVSGVIMDQTTNEALKDDEGKDITATKTFTADKADMEIELTFTINKKDIAGTTAVVFEDLVHNDVTVAFHHDIEDEEQSVHYPEIGTTATADDTKEHVTEAKETKIKDVVAYKNLIPGKTYTFSGYFVDKATGEAILVDGKKVEASKEYTPDKADGEVELVFEFDASTLKGKAIVAFETVSYEGVDVAIHADINDEEQTVYIPEIKTKATDAKTTIDHSKAEEQITVIDTVSFKNLKPGLKYVMKGVLMNKATGSELLVDGKKVEASKEFTPTEASGTVEIEFTFKGIDLKGDTLVVFETCYYNDIEVAVHTDIDDADQTDYIPEVLTEALADDTKAHVTEAKQTTITDTITMNGLKPNTKYTVTGELYVKETGESLGVTNTMTFTTGALAEGEAHIDNYVIEMPFTFDASVLEGQTVVVFETLYTSEKEVAVHHDINSEEQSVHFPKVRTSAKDVNTGTHTGVLVEKDGKATVTIEDTVTLWNLLKGQKYLVGGTLHTSDGAEFLVNGAAVEVDSGIFEGKGGEQSVTLTFTFEGDYEELKKSLEGKALVVFENLFLVRQTEGTTTDEEGNETPYSETSYDRVGSHSDATDKDQTIYFPQIRTTAVDRASGTHTITHSDKAVIDDTISFKGLTPGETYKVYGEVMTKDGKATGITAEATFTPEATEGTYVLSFTFDSAKYANSELVVFETLYTADGYLVAEHKDLTDKDQTVTVPKRVGRIGVKVPGTGDGNDFTGYLLMLLAAVAALALILLKKKKALMMIALIAVSMIALKPSMVRADDYITKTETYDITTEEDKYQQAGLFEDAIQDGDKAYDLDTVTYTVDSKEPLTEKSTFRTEKTSDILGEDEAYLPPDSIEIDGVTYNLVESQKKNVVISNARSESVTETVRYEGLTEEMTQEDIPATITTDHDGTQVALTLSSFAEEGGGYIEQQLPVTYYDYGEVDYYEFNGIEVPHSDTTPLVGQYPEALLGYLNIDPTVWELAGVEWDGGVYTQDGQARRNAVATVRRWQPYYTATYTGTYEVPEETGVIYNDVYEGIIEEAIPGMYNYTITATAQYTLRPAESIFTPAVIAGISIGVIAVAALIVWLLFLMKKRRKNEREKIVRAVK